MNPAARPSWPSLLVRFWYLPLVLLAATGTAAAVVVGLASGDRDRPSQVLAQQPPPAAPEALTLIEAWDRVVAELARWGADWRIASLSSTDVRDAPNGATGSDGRRAWAWGVRWVSDSGPP